VWWVTQAQWLTWDKEEALGYRVSQELLVVLDSLVLLEHQDLRELQE
jgi:hypothetical protein